MVGRLTPAIFTACESSFFRKTFVVGRVGFVVGLLRRVVADPPQIIGQFKRRPWRTVPAGAAGCEQVGQKFAVEEPEPSIPAGIPDGDLVDLQIADRFDLPGDDSSSFSISSRWPRNVRRH